MDVGESNRLNPIEEQISSLREVCNALNNNLSYRDTPFVALNPEKTKKESEEALIEVIIYLLKSEIMKLLKFLKKIRTNEKLSSTGLEIDINAFLLFLINPLS